MSKYCVNTQTDNHGDHEVHNIDTCKNLPATYHRKDLGEHYSCSSAVTEAKKTYPTADGCAHCSPACHKT